MCDKLLIYMCSLCSLSVRELLIVMYLCGGGGGVQVIPTIFNIFLLDVNLKKFTVELDFLLIV